MTASASLPAVNVRTVTVLLASLANIFPPTGVEAAKATVKGYPATTVDPVPVPAQDCPVVGLYPETVVQPAGRVLPVAHD